MPASLAATQPAHDATAGRSTHRDVFETHGSPHDSTLIALTTLRENFDLTVDNLQSNGFRWTLSGSDHFSAAGHAGTVRGQFVDIACEWLAEDRTRMIVTSDLPDAQYAAVIAEVRRAVLHPATEPAAE